VSVTDPDGLAAAVDELLIQHLPGAVKAVIDAELRTGTPPDAVLRRIHLVTGGPNATPGGLTYLACEAYVQRVTEGGLPS
jgi:hypothetical protein